MGPKEGIENPASTAGKDELDLVGVQDGFKGYVKCVDTHPLRADPDQTDLSPQAAKLENGEKFQRKMPFWKRCCLRFCRCCCCCCPPCCKCCCCADDTDD